MWPSQRKVSMLHTTVYRASKKFVPTHSVWARGEGAKIVRILCNCFSRGYLYKIGTSVTHGGFGVTFNIHQKTNMFGGSTNHGWPDPGYLDRLKSECAVNVPNADGCEL